MSKRSTEVAPPRAHYTAATESAFRRAIDALEKSLPEHHAALSALLDAGRFHDVESIVDVFEGSEK